jgi:hypothetical protein
MIWTRSKISSTHLVPIGSCYFGSFKILDEHISDPSAPGFSYVDYGFGSDESSFAGCHRFQIRRQRVKSEFQSSGVGEDKEPQVQITLQHFRCNPTKNVPSAAEYIAKFHYVYAKALFADGIRSVLVQ